MTWEETIKFIRTKEEYSNLVEKACFEEHLSLNIERYRQGEEFKESLKLLKKYAPKARRILYIGSGNGVSSISFALEGYEVVTVEPDPSLTIGAGAIEILKTHYQLKNIEIYQTFAEEINFKDGEFDIVYARQCMHHAYDLTKFVHEMGRVLKNGGLFFAARDHVIFNEQDKQWFLASHPLQQFYGGENAFTSVEYCMAIKNAGLLIEKEFSYFETPINYFPSSTQEIEEIYPGKEAHLIKTLEGKIGLLSKIGFIQNLYFKRQGFSKSSVYDESKIAGRMHSFIALKP